MAPRKKKKKSWRTVIRDLFKPKKKKEKKKKTEKEKKEEAGEDPGRCAVLGVLGRNQSFLVLDTYSLVGLNCAVL
jgi:hypothetical protein